MNTGQMTLDDFGAACDRGEYYKTAEIGKILAKKFDTLLYYHIDKGNLKAYKAGGERGHWWISEADLREYAAKYNVEIDWAALKTAVLTRK